MHILLVATYNSADIFDLWSKAIYKLKPPPDKVIFCENNSSDDTLKKLAQFKLPHEIIRIWVREDAAKDNPYGIIAEVRQLLLTRARQLNPDYAIFLDDDIIVKTPTMIPLLTGWNKMLENAHVIGGTYLRRFPRGVYLASKWKWQKGLYRLWKYPPNGNITISEPWVTSAGCLCLSRKIIQDRRVNFSPRIRDTCAEDFGYCLWARKYGYKIYLDHLVKLKHIKEDRENGGDRPWMVEFYGDGKKRFVDFAF